MGTQTKRSLGVLLTLFLLAGISPPLCADEGRVIPGVFFNGCPLGGKEREEVLAVVEEVNERMAGCPVIMELPGGEKIETTYREMGLGIDAEKVWQEAFFLGRSGKWWNDIWTRWQTGRKGTQVPLVLQLDREKALETLNRLTAPWFRAPREASLVIKPDDKVEITPHEYGRDVDKEAALLALEEKIKANPGAAIYVALKFSEIRPAKLQSDLEAYGITGLVSKHSTQFNTARLNRTHNIQLAAKALDYCFVFPGQVFSFNEVVGPRTKESGYDEADIILQNELVPDIGGGVCQVSTTLYNAVLKAELEIIERTPHSLIVPYVSPGLDATVVYGFRDFKFRNSGECCLVIKTEIYQGNLTVKIFGEAKTGRRVVLKSFKEKEIPPGTIYRDDPQVPQGQYILERAGEPGYVYRVERFVYDAQGSLLKKEFISRDYYPPVDRIIKTFSSSPSLSN
ncbi:MAG: VanW family protein [Peptococcaceae bacterium]|nr:VanW family protein [Peptococcaceae bacterium]MDH7525153.1 VanW family protein [Peptococcaceae bacterium]